MNIDEYRDAINKAEKCRKEWRDDCMHFWGKVLIGEKGHWCPDWDYLPLDETCAEFEHCLCFDDTNTLDSLLGT